VGLRERKKAQTRQAIAQAAWELFSEHGFDRVTVAVVADAAQVAEATVFNYFPAKEDLFYSGLDVFEEGLIAAVAGREPGGAVVGAVRRHLLSPNELLERIARGDTDALERLRTVHRIVVESPALQAREHALLARNAAALARLIIEESGPDADAVAAQAAAGAMIGVHRALIDLVRRRVLADDRPRALGADIRAEGELAFDLLGRGLRDYALKTEQPTSQDVAP
jgi:AcrR family transcriptional regulator